MPATQSIHAIHATHVCLVTSVTLACLVTNAMSAMWKGARVMFAIQSVLHAKGATRAIRKHAVWPAIRNTVVLLATMNASHAKRHAMPATSKQDASHAIMRIAMDVLTVMLNMVAVLATTNVANVSPLRATFATRKRAA